MKKILLSLAVSFLVLGLNAQVAVHKEKVDYEINHANTKVADTIWTYYDRATTFHIYSVTGGGYIFGNNTHYTESAMNYDGIANADVTEVLFWVGAKWIEGTADDLTVNVYEASNDTTPGTVLGSTTVGMDVIDTSAATNGLNFIPFPSVIATSGNDFFIGINLTSDDTIGVVCNNPLDGNGQGEKRAVINYSGNWASVDYVFGGFDADGMYLPIVDIVSGADFMEQNGLKIKRAYPNPAKDYTTINYSVDSKQNVSIKVFDLTGKIIYSDSEIKSAGNHNLKVDLSKVSTGNYYYTISTAKAKMTSKLVKIQ